jgi:hypothetical protein
MSAADGKLLPMTVDNLGFLLERLGQDCHPLQFLRELTTNSLEAVARAGGEGEVLWDEDRSFPGKTNSRKLSIVDTGDGMTGEEMVRFVNALSSSSSKQSMQGNFGVGAKIAAATRNPAGVIYMSWKGGQGAMIQLWRDPKTKQYGLRQFDRGDGRWSHFLPIAASAKPPQIEEHGTKVILLGESPEADTMRAPEDAAAPSRWISRYLNTRYFRLPRRVRVRAREESDVLREIVGQERYLGRHCAAHGTKALKGAEAHWWILKEEDAERQNSGWIESSGHVAVLYKDELYEMTSGRAAPSKLQQFGITFGYKHVVIYVEPKGGDLTTNTARTMVLRGNEPMPWLEWAQEFRDHLPKELADFVAVKAESSLNTDHAETIRERLREILDLYDLSRYRPSGGEVRASQLTSGGIGAAGLLEPSENGEEHEAPDGEQPPQGTDYTMFADPEGEPSTHVQSEKFPEVRWISTKTGTRDQGEIEDRAARFLADQNLLLVNADFRGFHDLASKLVKEYGSRPGAAELATESVRAWFEQALVETVLGVRALKDSKEWSLADIHSALSEEALTSAVMQRYHVLLAVKRELASKLGRAKPARRAMSSAS